MLKGRGEVRHFDWKKGQGLIHKAEFAGCPKDCKRHEHCVVFTWRHILNPDDVAEGKVFSFTAYPKGDDSADLAKSLWPVYIGR